ncbi:SDR family NAD(P)-dependent oxidoreductase [Nakamurella sp.]|uniref:SDR family NAD(P)-dependent oxidoreductase n=1 Tax=Nakamurella sp. TaxID=1869182 RepID=UPI003B3A0C44
MTTPSPSGRLAGKVAVITGTGGGQGRAAARLFAAEGATVVGCDLKAAGASETAELVRRDGGRMDSTAPVDLTDEDAVRGWIDETAARHGRIDILYNNAGATRFARIQDQTYQDWLFTLRNELDVVFLATKHAWPHLQRGGGSVILVGSTAGLTGSLTLMRSAHSATKGGVIAMTRQLAAEGAAFGIRVNCISPGMVLSPATANDIFGDRRHPMYGIRDHIPLGRIGTPEDIARCALFLAGDESSYMTGANLVVDGGWSVVLPGATAAT